MIPTKLLAIYAAIFFPAVYVIHTIGLDTICRSVIKFVFTNL